MIATSCGGGAPAANGGTGGAGGGTTTKTSSSSSSTTSSTSSSSSSTTSSSGTVISVAPGWLFQSETSVAAAPDGRVAVAWIDIAQTGSSIGYAFSTDDGATFGPPAAISSPGGRLASDPSVVVDAAQNVWVAWVGYFLKGGGAPSDMHVYVAKAPAGSTTFGAPVEVSDPADTSQYDKPWIAAPAAGGLVVTYERAGSDLAVVAARSADGTSWQQAAIASDTTASLFRNLALPCAPKTGGRIWATYLAIDETATKPTAEVRLSRSDDGGATWSAETTVSAPGEAVAFDDPMCVAEGNDVWISYGLSSDSLMEADMTTPKLSAIRLAHSADGGQTVAARLDAHDAAAGTFFMHPQIALEGGGAIDLTYYAGNADMDTAGTFRRSRAATPATGFGPSMVVDQPITSSRNAASWPGWATTPASSSGAARSTRASRSTTRGPRTSPSPRPWCRSGARYGDAGSNRDRGLQRPLSCRWTIPAGRRDEGGSRAADRIRTDAHRLTGQGALHELRRRKLGWRKQGESNTVPVGTLRVATGPGTTAGSASKRREPRRSRGGTRRGGRRRSRPPHPRRCALLSRQARPPAGSPSREGTKRRAEESNLTPAGVFRFQGGAGSTPRMLSRP